MYIIISSLLLIAIILFIALRKDSTIKNVHYLIIMIILLNFVLSIYIPKLKYRSLTDDYYKYSIENLQENVSLTESTNRSILKVDEISKKLGIDFSDFIFYNDIGKIYFTAMSNKSYIDDLIFSVDGNGIVELYKEETYLIIKKIKYYEISNVDPNDVITLYIEYDGDKKEILKIYLLEK